MPFLLAKLETLNPQAIRAGIPVLHKKDLGENWLTSTATKGGGEERRQKRTKVYILWIFVFHLKHMLISIFIPCHYSLYFFFQKM